MSRAAHLAASPDPLAEIELRRQLCREAYRDGYAACLADIRREADLEFAGRPIKKAQIDLTLAELELLRWGPNGRERFGDPRPGDYIPSVKQVAA